ncbi:MAG: hypothetical protein ACQEXQ_16410 [Bacillota bacterium]
MMDGYIIGIDLANGNDRTVTNPILKGDWLDERCPTCGELKQKVETLQNKYDKYREHAVSRVKELESEIELLKKRMHETSIDALEGT